MVRFPLLIVCCGVLLAQSTPGPASFEIASVKPTVHGRDANGWSRSFVDTPTPERLQAQNASLRELLEFAFHIETYQLSGPSWLNDDNVCFDVEAKAPAGTPKRQFHAMLETLLKERFHLAVHRETQPVAAYNLVADPRDAARRKDALHAPKPEDIGGGIWSSGGKVNAKATSMAYFATWLAGDLHRPVFDATGLTGDVAFQFEYDPSNSANTEKPSLPEALVRQLGLRLENTTKPVEIVVVDHIDRTPVGN